MSRLLDFYRSDLRHPTGAGIQWLFPAGDPSRAIGDQPTREALCQYE